MTKRSSKGKPTESVLDPKDIPLEIVQALTEKSSQGTITCGAAISLSSKLKCTAQEIGNALDAMDIRIQKCQLGLFGYPASNPKPVRPLDTVSADLRQALNRASVGKTKTCVACARVWEIAEQMELSKMKVAGACESLGIKISPCQLGAF